jgi:methyltransferase
MGFLIFIGFIIVQRLSELAVARRNEQWMKAKGAIEFGSGHYPFIVFVHTAFILSTIFEVYYYNRGLSTFWPVLLAVFLLTQGIRVWAISSLGPYWNTKIIVLPNADIVKKGPYRFIKHPNYLVVVVEIITIPLLFNAYFTAFIFTGLNLLILGIRIPAEEQALKELTYYEAQFEDNSRFIPKLLKKYDK